MDITIDKITDADPEKARIFISVPQPARMQTISIASLKAQRTSHATTIEKATVSIQDIDKQITDIQTELDKPENVAAFSKIQADIDAKKAATQAFLDSKKVADIGIAQPNQLIG